MAKKQTRKARKPERKAKRTAVKPKRAAAPVAARPSAEPDPSLSPLQAALARRRASLHGQLPG